MNKQDRKEAVRELWQTLYVATMAHVINPNVAARVGRMTLESAEAFVSLLEAFDAGEMEPPKPLKGPQLANCSSPNLDKRHPYNLVSQRFGNLEKVATIHEYLQNNPEAETYEDSGWGKPEVKIARHLFPHYVPNGKKLDA